MRRTIVAVVVIAIVLVGIIGYAVVGFAYAAARVSNADKSLNTVVSHQNSLNSTFKDINTKFSGLNSSNPDLKQTRTLYDQFVANAKSTGNTVDQDDSSLVSARASLREQSWLTILSRGTLDKESVRIDHARNALSSAKTLAADYVQAGQFFQSSIDVEIDLLMLGTQTANADLAGSRATLTTMKTHVDKALQLSVAPGLPTDLHDLMVDFQALITDFGKLLDAAAGGDAAAVNTAQQGVEKDATKIGGYNLDKIQTAMNDYYQPMIDTYNSELAKATA
jgi:peptidoglycan hydrolase CwlO-like protein